MGSDLEKEQTGGRSTDCVCSDLASLQPLQRHWLPLPCSLDTTPHSDLRALARLVPWPGAPHSLTLQPIMLASHPAPRPTNAQDCLICLLSAPTPVPAGQPPGLGLAHGGHPLGGEAGEDGGPHFTGDKTKAQRERPEVRQREALRSPRPGKGISSRSGGCGVLGQLVGRLTGLLVWQRQLGLLGPNPHPECRREGGRGRGRGRQQLVAGPAPAWGSAGRGCTGTVSLCLSLSLFRSLFLFLSLCLSPSVSLGLCFFVSVSVSPLSLSASSVGAGGGAGPISEY